MTGPDLIGLSGYAGVGKDTAAEILAGHGYRRVAFADALRGFLYDTRPDVQEIVDRLGWEQAKRLDPCFRRLLEEAGAAARRHFGAEVLVDAALDQIMPGERVVITDVRMADEVVAVADWGGLLVRIERPGVGPASDDATEHDLDGFDNWDHLVVNDGSVEDLAGKLEAIVAGG